MSPDQMLALLAGFAFGVLASGGLLAAAACLRGSGSEVPSSECPAQWDLYRGGQR